MTDSQILLYRLPDGEVKVEALLRDETLWLTQKAMAQLFQVGVPAISKHLKNIYTSGELQEEEVISKMETTTQHGAMPGKTQTTLTTFYNLDAVIAVGYRVNSRQATLFRQWATRVLREYLIKGYALDDQRLRELGGGDYWHQLLERIRDIRASEKVLYRQVLEIYATSIDYDPRAGITLDFFRRVQNKIHYAIHGRTAAEVIVDRASAEKDFMGLTTFRGSQPTLAEARVAKNYLDARELRAMGQLVSGYLDFAERQAERHQPMTMADWSAYLDRVLTISGERLLEGGGTVTHDQAMAHAAEQFRQYKQRTLSDVEHDYLAALRQLEISVKE